MSDSGMERTRRDHRDGTRSESHREFVQNVGDVVAEVVAKAKGEKPKTGAIAADRLRSLVERIERLHAEREALSNDVRDIYAEAKSAGFDVKVLRQLIRIRRQEAAEVEEEALLDVYRRALGM